MVRLRGGRWEMEILPERGGRIGSLRLGGMELLDRGIGVDDPRAAGFVEGGAWGWDEMVPTVEACVWRGTELPDHGEAWRLPWVVEGEDGATCTMRCEGRALAWRLQRRIQLAETVRVDYALTAAGHGDVPGFWCAHPLFRYEQDMEVDVGARLMSFAPKKSGKLFLPRDAIDRAHLSWRSGPAIEIAWDSAVVRHCSVWICNGDLGGYRQVAVEPATGGKDRPDSDEPAPVLGSGGSIRWWLEVREASRVRP